MFRSGLKQYLSESFRLHSTSQRCSHIFVGFTGKKFCRGQIVLHPQLSVAFRTISCTHGLLGSSASLREDTVPRTHEGTAGYETPPLDPWMATEKANKKLSCGSQQPPLDYAAKIEAKREEIGALPEVIELEKFARALENGSIEAPTSSLTATDVGISKEEFMHIITAGLTTSVLHVESRKAAVIGEGFYTIGPSGEELLSCVGLLLETTDPMALHYRHLATQIARHMRYRSLDDIIIDRARGHVVSKLDPVTGGVHCSLGGGDFDYIVTSTLASQGPPAVGRAIGNGLAHHLGIATHFPKRAVSYVSTGDGSVNNAHFLSAVNMAEYAKYRRYKCPIVFGISDNNMCISLKGYGWLTSEWMKKLRMPVFEVDGTDILDVWCGSKAAIKCAMPVPILCRESRASYGPVAVIYKNLPRRFGHAATDRQGAYLSETEIQTSAQKNPLAGACALAVREGFTTYPQLAQMFRDLEMKSRTAFEVAATEPKLDSITELVERVSQPLVKPNIPSEQVTKASKRKHVMRKNMNLVVEEIMRENLETVYIGEDVQHGGYYLVTEGLFEKFPTRVRDFPPDETSLFGIAMGFAQCGLVPILEMPYAKYLDCGYDMFGEVAISNWLSNSKHPNGMIIRLQGFDKGVFGGNYHTHNMLQIPPGVDVVCYSNGEDYARGWRYAIEQAKAGRVVMSVDSTNLLNLRHLHDEDDKWRRQYPPRNELLSFEDVVHYGNGRRLGIVTYGNGVVAALQAREELSFLDKSEVTIIDSPYLTCATKGLREAVSELDAVVFADVCKQGQHPLAGIIAELKVEGVLPGKWTSVAGIPTYNPLGSTITFLSKEAIVQACDSLAV